MFFFPRRSEAEYFNGLPENGRAPGMFYTDSLKFTFSTNIVYSSSLLHPLQLSSAWRSILLARYFEQVDRSGE
jgi:hypothetical protein